MSTRRLPLRTRFTFTGVAIVTVLVLLVNAFVYLSLRDRLLTNLELVLDAREQLTTELARDLNAFTLSQRLDDLGLRAVVRTADGEVIHSRGIADPSDGIPTGTEGGAPLETRLVPLQDGGEAIVAASRGGIDETLERLLILEAIGTAVAVALAYGLFSRVSGRVLRPVRDVSTTARRIAAGGAGERLTSHPDDPELAEMVEAFNDMLDELEAAVDSSHRFLADAAHQLRTPIAGMRASVATLMRTEDPADRDRMMENIARESARTSRLLSSLLRVARLDQAETLTLRSVDLERIVEELVDNQRPVAPHLRFTVRTDGATTVIADESSIREAIANLIDNASRHATSLVDVEITGDGKDTVLRVADDGPGVPEHHRRRIFERFVSLDGGGSGLGLPIAQGIAELHGGSVRCDDDGFVMRLAEPPDGPPRDTDDHPSEHLRVP